MTLRPLAVMAALLLLFGASIARAQGRTAAGPPSASVRKLDGLPYVGANDLARLLDGAKYWRADVRKLVVRAQGHRMTFTADNPIVIVDDRTLRLSAPVRSLGGELQIPLEFIAMLPRDSLQSRLTVDAGNTRVRSVPPGGYVYAPRMVVVAGETRVIFSADGAAAAAVVGRDRAHLRVRLPGVFAGELRDSMPAGSLVSAVRRVGGAGAAGGAGGANGADGVTLEFQISPQASGYRMEYAAGRATLVLSSEGGALESFAPEGPAGPRSMRVIVLDPGHGGSDLGVQAEGVSEKDLSLALARLVATELGRRGVRVTLTRNDDRLLATEARAEIANRAHADLVLSLHFDGFPSATARGATAWCPPAKFAETANAGSGTSAANIAALAPAAMTPWRDVATRHAVEGRALAEALATALEAREQGPARVREWLTQPLLGINAPGVMLECATLSNAADRARVTADGGLQALALAITEGLLAWQRHD